MQLDKKEKAQHNELLFAVLITQTIQSVNVYLQGPTYTETLLHDQENTTFPVLTICLACSTDKPLLSSIREKLANNRLSTPFFNTEKYTKDLEKAFEKAYTNYLHNKSPKNIWV